MEWERLEGLEEEVVLPSSGQRSIPYWQDRKRRRKKWVLVPTGEEEAGTGQLVGLVQVAEPWPAAAAAVHFSVRLSFLNVPFCFLHPSPIHRAAAAKILRAAAAGTGIGGVLLLVSLR